MVEHYTENVEEEVGRFLKNWPRNKSAKPAASQCSMFMLPHQQCRKHFADDPAQPIKGHAFWVPLLAQQ